MDAISLFQQWLRLNQLQIMLDYSLRNVMSMWIDSAMQHAQTIHFPKETNQNQMNIFSLIQQTMKSYILCEC